jgi:hypothetical protein
VRGFGVAIVLIGSLVRPLPAAAVATPEEIEAALRATVEDRTTVQRELPREPDPTATPHDDGKGPKLDPEEGEGRSSAAPGVIGTLSRILLWALVVAAVLALVGWLASELLASRRRAAAGGPVLAPERPLPERLADRPDPDALAAAGRWDEAVHALLTDALFVLGTRARITDAMTGRELVASLTMPESARPPLGALVAHVERTLFAEVPADEALFAAARRDHQAFRAELTA